MKQEREASRRDDTAATMQQHRQKWKDTSQNTRNTFRQESSEHRALSSVDSISIDVAAQARSKRETAVDSETGRKWQQVRNCSAVQLARSTHLHCRTMLEDAGLHSSINELSMNWKALQG
jgi:hypothetical protein